MAQATFSIRMDEKLKCEFDMLCSDFGMNATTAFNFFARAVVREKKIPFEIQASSAVTERERGWNAFMALRQQAKMRFIACPVDCRAGWRRTGNQECFFLSYAGMWGDMCGNCPTYFLRYCSFHDQ